MRATSLHSARIWACVILCLGAIGYTHKCEEGGKRERGREEECGRRKVERWGGKGGRVKDERVREYGEEERWKSEE